MGEDARRAEGREPGVDLCEGTSGRAVDVDDAPPPARALVLVLVLVGEPAQEGVLVGELGRDALEGPKGRDEAGKGGRRCGWVEGEVELGSRVVAL